MKLKNPLPKKDGRFVIHITDERTARNIQRVMAREGLSQQEYINKYLVPNMPKDDWDVPYRYYEDFSKQFLIICQPSKVKEAVRDAISIFWTILIRVYRHEIDAEKLRDLLEKSVNDPTLKPDKPPHLLDQIQVTQL